jgi:hypothetical protein
MPVTPRADKISHGLCLFLRYLYTFTIIPFFALLGGLFDLFQMSQKEEDVLSLEDSDNEYFDTAEAGSSADEMEDCLSAASEGVAVAEFTLFIPLSGGWTS